MKKIVILLLLLSTGLFAQAYDGYAKQGPVRGTDGTFTGDVTIADSFAVGGNATIDGKLVVDDSLRVGNIQQDVSAYINYGATLEASGYGLRDNAGTMQFKNSAGAWTDIGAGVGTSAW